MENYRSIFPTPSEGEMLIAKARSARPDLADAKPKRAKDMMAVGEHITFTLVFEIDGKEVSVEASTGPWPPVVLDVKEL